MAERRMFAKTIIDSDAFLDMPMSAQLLYFHLSMRGDDDGFVNSPKRIQRTIGASDDDMRILIAKAFIIPFDNGVVVIKHWRINNYIRNDRYTETVYTEQKAQLEVKPDGGYRLKSDVGIPSGNQAVDERYTQYRLGEVRLGKESKVELAKNIKEKLSRAGAYTGVHDALVDEVVDTLCGLHEGQTLKFDGVTYSAEDFQQMAQLLEVEDVCRVVNSLLAHRNEIKNRKYYILATVAGVMRGEGDEQ